MAPGGKGERMAGTDSTSALRAGRRTFHVVLIKPTHYDDDGIGDF
jgi:hypothetical protein